MLRVFLLFVSSFVISCSLCADTVTFTPQLTQQAPSLSFTGEIFGILTIDITGKKDGLISDVAIVNGLGLGVVGGSNDHVVEPGEQLNFDYTSGPVLTAQYGVNAAGPSTTLTSGDRIVEVFGAGGSSLGTFFQSGIGIFNVFDLVGATVPVSGFSLLASDSGQPDNGFTVSIINGNPYTATVPEPSSLAIILPLLAGGVMRRRSR